MTSGRSSGRGHSEPDQFMLEPVLVDVRDDRDASAKRQNPRADAGFPHEVEISAVARMNDCWSQRGDEGTNRPSLHRADHLLAQAGAPAGSYPELVQHDLQPPVADQRHEVPFQADDQALRMEAVTHELQTDPVRGLLLQKI